MTKQENKNGLKSDSSAIGDDQRRRIMSECFEKCVHYCLSTPEFVRQWERLSGNKIKAESGIAQMIDEATGYQDEKYKELFGFIEKFVFIPRIENMHQEFLNKPTEK